MKLPVRERVNSVRLRRRLEAKAVQPLSPMQLQLKFKCNRVELLDRQGEISSANWSVRLQLFIDNFTKLQYSTSK